MKKELIDVLDKNNYSCIVCNNDQIRTFEKKGVMDLYELYHNDFEFLKGAYVVDKIVGKGAASLLVKGQIEELWTRVISKSALDLLQMYNVKVGYMELVPYIINREGTGGCPLELLCGNINDVETLMPIIDKFVKSIKIGNFSQRK